MSKEDNTEITEIKQDKRKDLPQLFKKGQSGNPAGRPVGSGYKQKWDRMITKVAEEKGITNDQAELDLFVVAYDQALKGNFQFFKDAMDRVYGPVKHDATLNVEKLENLTIVLDRDED